MIFFKLQVLDFRRLHLEIVEVVEVKRVQRLAQVVDLQRVLPGGDGSFVLVYVRVEVVEVVRVVTAFCVLLKLTQK